VCLKFGLQHYQAYQHKKMQKQYEGQQQKQIKHIGFITFPRRYNALAKKSLGEKA
jgi:hypothetical protein